MDKAKLVEKLKSVSPEERSIIREALAEIDPDTSLTGEEITALKELLSKKKGKKSIFDGLWD